MKKISIHVLYIGTTKLAALKGYINTDETLVVEKLVRVPAYGFIRGVVGNVEQAANQLRKLIDQLGKDVDPQKIEFQVVLSNEYLRTHRCSSSVYFGELMRSITRNDIQKVIGQTRGVATIPLEEYIIQDVPQEYVVNDLGGIIDPIELEARRLGVNLLLFTVDATIIHNISKALDRVDILASSFIPRALASRFAVLREEEKRDGIVLVDMGGYVTDVVYIKNNIIQEYKTIAVGGEHISSYLSRTLGIPHTEARRLKERFGSAIVLSAFEDEIIPVVDIFGKTRLNLNKKRLYDLIHYSSKEMIGKIKPVIDGINKKVGTVSGVVATGGTMALEGLLEMSMDVYGVPVRLGVTRKVHGPRGLISTPQYTSPIGVLGCLLDSYKKDAERFANRNFISKKLLQVREWIQEYF